MRSLGQIVQFLVQPSWKNRSIQNFISLFQQKCLSTCSTEFDIGLFFPRHGTLYLMFSLLSTDAFCSLSVLALPEFFTHSVFSYVLDLLWKSRLTSVTSVKWPQQKIGARKGKNQSLWFSPLNVFFLLILLVFYSLCIVTDTDKNKNNNLISLDFINLQIFLYFYNFNDHKLNLTFMLPAH